MLKPTLKTKPAFPAVLYERCGWDGEAGSNRFFAHEGDDWCSWKLVNLDQGIYQCEFDLIRFAQDSKGNWFPIED